MNMQIGKCPKKLNENTVILRRDSDTEEMVGDRERRGGG